MFYALEIYIQDKNLVNIFTQIKVLYIVISKTFTLKSDYFMVNATRTI